MMTASTISVFTTLSLLAAAVPTSLNHVSAISVVAVESGSSLNSSTVAMPPVTATSSASGTSPYWRRPGCYRVGHTRTISIPGCVKFNITTNACRGYCMSYSIPASEDLAMIEDAHQLSEIAGDSGGGMTPLRRRRKSLNLEDELESKLDYSREQSIAVPVQVHPKVTPMPAKSDSNYGNNQVGRSAKEDRKVVQQRDSSPLFKPIPVGQLRPIAIDAPFSPAVSVESGDGKRREVVSVSQCCNMMETEDVIVNLRCGVSETRRLLFKSAKTCECFFCKHV